MQLDAVLSEQPTGNEKGCAALESRRGLSQRPRVVTILWRCNPAGKITTTC